MLGSRLFAQQKRSESSLPNCHLDPNARAPSAVVDAATVNINASSTNSRAIVGFIDQAYDVPRVEIHRRAEHNQPCQVRM
jgi:hypothetical protein